MKKNRDHNLIIDFLNEYENVALLNAQELLSEAELLYKNNCYARTYYLALASIEETGKAQIAFASKGRNLSDEGLCNKIKKSMDCHSTKITSAFTSWLIKSPNKNEVIDKCMELITHLEHGREFSMYTDIKNNNIDVSKPSEVIRQRAAKDTIALATNCLHHTKEYLSTNTPIKTNSHQDKLLCIPTNKTMDMFSTRDFWDFYIDQVEQGNNDHAKSTARYYDEYYNKRKLYNIKNS